MELIKVVLADDHTIVRNGIKFLLESTGEVEVIAEASNGIEAIEKVREMKPAILICDIRMPVMNGLEAASQLQKELTDTKILILSMHDDDEYILKSVESGASGYLLKDTTKDEFIKALKTILNGDKYFSGDISNILVKSYLTKKEGQSTSLTPSLSEAQFDYHITKREKQILQLIYEAKSNKEIADLLEKSVRTIETHRFNIMKKLQLNNITDLMKKIESEPKILK